MARKTISQRIALAGGDEVKKQMSNNRGNIYGLLLADRRSAPHWVSMRFL
ncbi:MAG: hypothetical protein ACU0B9_19110 [Limimaricola soesokkakensis]